MKPTEAVKRATWRPRDEAPDFDRDAVGADVLTKLIAGWRRLCEDERDSVIARGLVEGETVVIEGQLRVVPGKLVEVLAPAGTGEAHAKGKKQRKPS